MDLLKIVDILLGVSVVMLLMSLVVTALTEMLLGLVNQKGRTMRNGLQKLLLQLDASLSPERAHELSGALLKHPMIADAGNRTGHVIQLHELAELLLTMAGGELWPNEPRVKDTDNRNAAPTYAQDARRMLANAGVQFTGVQAGEVLRNVRATAVKLLQSNPEMKENQRRELALLTEFKGDFIDKLFTLFDANIERIQARYAVPVRAYTILSAAIIAFSTQLDTLYLVNKLSVDGEFREQLVSKALKLESTNAEKATAATKKDPATTETTAAATDNTAATKKASVAQPRIDLASLSDEQKQRVAELRDLGVFPPTGILASDNTLQVQRLLGILLSIALLSLGAPFWYDTLKNLIRLRSMLAQRDDEERSTRQQAGPGTPDARTDPPGPSPALPANADEQPAG